MQHQISALTRVAAVGSGGLVESFAPGLQPPRLTRAARGLSGRPTCRIYAHGDVWILEFDAASAWLDERAHASRHLRFPTLAAAVGYAKRHGLDYRIERPRQPATAAGRNSSTRRLPRSWLARLARDGRSGEIHRALPRGLGFLHRRKSQRYGRWHGTS